MLKKLCALLLLTPVLAGAQHIAPAQGQGAGNASVSLTSPNSTISINGTQIDINPAAGINWSGAESFNGGVTVTGGQLGLTNAISESLVIQQTATATACFTPGAINFTGPYWNGTTSAQNTVSLTTSCATGTNGGWTLNIGSSGSTGLFRVAMPGAYVTMSYLQTQGLIAGIRTITASVVLNTNDFTVLCNATTAAVTGTLPASPISGQIYNFKKIDSSANACTLSGNGKNIDGAATFSTTTQYANDQIEYDGTQWWVI